MPRTHFPATRFDTPSNTEQGVQRSVRRALDDDPQRIDQHGGRDAFDAAEFVSVQPD
ncbi:hypothetical protein [Nocardia sp. NPDC004860]|uniref:hypothetical protein n=1 Tax=Nocardia sp. NPDC004860 TaxID=3154557 RepID=UPI0033A3D77E